MSEISIAPVGDQFSEEMSALLLLYEQAIPASERRSLDAVRRLAGSDTHRVAVAHNDRALLGFSILYLGASVALLEYLAVDKQCRGAGLGALLYEDARRHAGKRPMIVEVEDDRGGGADRTDRRRRIAFYAGAGCRRIEGVRYILPLPAREAPPPLTLLVDNHAGEDLPSATLRTWLQDIYTGAYGCDAVDPRLELMLPSGLARLGLTAAAAGERCST